MDKPNNKITELFDLLDKWRYFPAYQLERRSDIFFAIYLKTLISQQYKFQIDAIIPEFPVRIGTIYTIESNESFKMDYVAVCQEKKKVFLVELKTDISSVRENQIKYFRRAQKINIKGLIDGLIKIYDATSQKNKYQNLLREVERLGWLTQTSHGIVNNDKAYEIDILYILPNKKQIEHISELQNDESFKVLTFDDIIRILKPYHDEVAARFIQSLERWKINPNDVVVSS